VQATKQPVELRELKERLAGEKSLLIMMQDNPDADVITSAVARRKPANVVSKVTGDACLQVIRGLYCEERLR